MGIFRRVDWYNERVDSGRDEAHDPPADDDGDGRIGHASPAQERHPVEQPTGPVVAPGPATAARRDGDTVTAPGGSPTSVPTGPAWARKPRRRTRLVAAVAVVLLLAGIGLVVGTYYWDSVPTPEQLRLPESTTVYYADGTTPIAKLGVENRTILTYDQMNDAVKQAIVAAEDQTFWTNSGVDFTAVLRAAKNNVTGGKTQGASTITQQYARIAADLKGVTYSRKLREAVMAWKLDDKYSKQQILEFYLNTVPFGRGAYGIEAAAQAFLGKTANRHAPPATQVTVAEAMVLASLVKQPEADPADPDGRPGYDPKRSATALQNSRARWTYVRDGMVAAGFLTREQADALSYPDTVKDLDVGARQSGLDRPTGLVVNHVLSELRQSDAFRNKPKDYLQNGGFRIITTIDQRVQNAAEAAADIRRPTAPEIVRGQPKNWQAALVAVEPGTGRVLGYYGGNAGTGADYAGLYYDDTGQPRGFGQHPPGSSFKVYDLAEALRQKVSVKSRWDSPAVKEFPASGRTTGSPAGPIRNAATAACQPNCTLWEATVASLNVTFFDLTEHLGPANVIDMAIKAGVDSMWANEAGKPAPVRIDLRGRSGQDVAGHFSTEVGLGQYGITVLDHANGMATFAAGGNRAQAHFVKSVTKGDGQVYTEQLTQRSIGLDQEHINQLDWTLKQVQAAKLSNGWDAAGKTGTWQLGNSLEENAHTWMVGYTGALAAAVWLGTTDGTALTTKDGGHDVFGASYPGPIWRQFMVDATAAMHLDKNKFKFGTPTFPNETASGSAAPSRVSAPPKSPRPAVTSCQPPSCPSSKPSPTDPPTPTQNPPSTTAGAPPTPTKSGRLGRCLRCRRRDRVLRRADVMKVLVDPHE
jgi:membrane peptidoglycan carboxypeptidase